MFLEVDLICQILIKINKKEESTIPVSPPPPPPPKAIFSLWTFILLESLTSQKPMLMPARWILQSQLRYGNLPLLVVKEHAALPA